MAGIVDKGAYTSRLGYTHPTLRPGSARHPFNPSRLEPRALRLAIQAPCGGVGGSSAGRPPQRRSRRGWSALAGCWTGLTEAPGHFLAEGLVLVDSLQAGRHGLQKIEIELGAGRGRGAGVLALRAGAARQGLTA